MIILDLVGEGRKIAEEVVIQWRDRRFRLWVSEEAGDWVPAFFEVNNEVDSDKEVDDETKPSTPSSVQAEDNMEEEIPEETLDGDCGPAVTMKDGNTDSHVDIPAKSFNAPAKIFNDTMVTGLKLENIDASIIGEGNMETSNDEAFIPGVNFDFDKIGNAEDLNDNFSKVIKWKKKQAVDIEVGRPTVEYSSSLEKTKAYKKPKDVGPVELEDLELNEEYQEGNFGKFREREDRGVNFLTDNPFDILNRDIENGDTSEEPFIDVSTTTKGDEVEKTVRLGKLLGADLQDHRVLVQETIMGEGVQLVDR